MYALFNPLTRHQFVEDRQNLLPILIDALEARSHASLIAMAQKHLIQQLTGDVDIAAKSVGGVTPEEKTVEERCFPLRSQRVDLFHHLTRRCHSLHQKSHT